jgi:hypothetical protein
MLGLQASLVVVRGDGERWGVMGEGEEGCGKRCLVPGANDKVRTASRASRSSHKVLPQPCLRTIMHHDLS